MDGPSAFAAPKRHYGTTQLAAAQIGAHGVRAPLLDNHSISNCDWHGWTACFPSGGANGNFFGRQAKRAAIAGRP